MVLPATIEVNKLYIPLPDLRRPEQMPSLPAWVASRIASLKGETQPHVVTGKWRMVSTLPTNLILDQAERDAIERHVADLEACYGPTPADDPSAEEKMVVVVTKMMLVLPAMKQNEASAETRGEAYMMALDDVPTWAVAAAVRRWFRGNAGDGHDYHWCPAPAELRELSLIELWRVKSRAKILRNLLRAEPLIEFSEEHCAMMRMRIADLFKGKLGIQPVGHDGSGGMVNAS